MRQLPFLGEVVGCTELSNSEAMRAKAMSACVLALVVGVAQVEQQRNTHHHEFSIVGEWERIGKPKATTRFRADGTFSMHVVGVRGSTVDMTGSYTLHGNVLERRTLKRWFSVKKRRLWPLRTSRYQLKWLSRNSFALTPVNWPKNSNVPPDRFVRRHSAEKVSVSNPPPEYVKQLLLAFAPKSSVHRGFAQWSNEFETEYQVPPWLLWEEPHLKNCPSLTSGLRFSVARPSALGIVGSM